MFGVPLYYLTISDFQVVPIERMGSMRLQLGKRSIMILVLTLLLLIMIPLDFVCWDTTLEWMDFDNEPMAAVMLWIFFVFAALTCVAALINRYDLAKATSLIALIFVVLAVVVCNYLSYSNFWDITDTQFGLAYLVVTAVIYTLSKGSVKNA